MSKQSNGQPPGRSAGWPYVVTGVVFAGVIGWISYTDALFVTRLAGNSGGIAYAYPSIPDGLIVFSLLAAWEASRAGVARSRWAVAGLVLGALMTLSANVGAGLAHSVLDAVIDGLVPVCFFIAVEIVLWHVRHGKSVAGERPRQGVSSGSPATQLDTVPPAAVEAAEARMRQALDLKFRYTDNQAKDDFRLTRAEVTAARKRVTPESPAEVVPTTPAAGASGQGSSPRALATYRPPAEVIRTATPPSAGAPSNGNGSHA